MLVWVLAISVKTRVPVVYLAASEVIGSRSVCCAVGTGVSGAGGSGTHSGGVSLSHAL